MQHLLVIPVFNEESNLPAMLDRIGSLQRSRKDFDLIFINDGSSDASAQLLKNVPGTIHHPANRGYGYTLREALLYGQDRGYAFVTTMDCDNQHDPADLVRFLSYHPEVDVLSGSRYLPECRVIGQPPADRREINRRIVRQLNARYSLGLTDAFCGFKRYRLAHLMPGAFTEDGYSFPLEFWVYAARCGLRIEEIAVDRIYTEEQRTFGVNLDQQRIRYRYYLETLRKAEHRFGPDFKLAHPVARAAG